MRRWLPILLVLLALAWPLPARAQGVALTGQAYLALGDSLALGVEAPANNDGQPGYPALLFQRMQGSIDPQIAYTNLGVAGAYTGSFVGGQLGAAEAAIASHNAAGRCVVAITLSIGGNDMGRIFTGEATASAAIAALTSNLGTILQRLSSAARNQPPGCNARIALMDYYNPYPGLPIPPTNEPLADAYQPQLNSIIRQTAAQYGVAVANVAQGFTGREGTLLYVNQAIYDNPLLRLPFTPWFEGNVDFHPRPAGHAVIADAFWSALGMVPRVPEVAALPNLIEPTVVLLAPWTCGECQLAGRAQAILPPLLEPRSYSIEWLGAQIWNRSTRPLLCWSFALLQAGLNTYALTLNQYWLPAVNDSYRLLYGLFFWLTSALVAFFHLGEEIRVGVWHLSSQTASGTVGSVATADELAGVLLAAWLSVFTGVLQSWQYLLTLYSGSVPELWRVLGDLTEHRPEQLTTLSEFWLFGGLVGALRALADSDLGWWLTAQIALFYTAALLFLVDQTGEL